MDYLMRMNYKMMMMMRRRRMNYKMRRRRGRRRRRRICTYSKMETENRLNQLLQNPKD